jgi:hypothetical protein
MTPVASTEETSTDSSTPLAGLSAKPDASHLGRANPPAVLSPQRSGSSSRETRPRDCPAQRTGSPMPHALILITKKLV